MYIIYMFPFFKITKTNDSNLNFTSPELRAPEVCSNGLDPQVAQGAQVHSSLYFLGGPGHYITNRISLPPRNLMQRSLLQCRIGDDGLCYCRYPQFFFFGGGMDMAGKMVY